MAQQRAIDSILKMMPKQKDTALVKSLNQLSYRYNTSDPAKGLVTAQQAYDLARKIRFATGVSRASMNIANAYRVTGNYNKAMDVLLKQLELDEKNGNAEKLASTNMNIAITYTLQLDYKKALPYYLKSDSIIRVNKIDTLAYFNFQNLGDIYERLGKIDSAAYYYSKSLARAIKMDNNYYIGATKSGLANCYVKNKEREKGLASYYEALHYLKLANEEDLFCETVFNMARFFEEDRKYDSALHYVHLMLGIAEKDHFQSRMLDANSFLASYYKSQRNTDSALFYLEKTTQLKDTINSIEKVKDFQQKTFNEDIRQAELAEKKRKEEEERSQQLQLLIIGIFIPIFFLLTLFLSQKKIHRKALQVLGIVSLLLLFEYLTLLLHPFVAELTHHTPVIELLIFVGIAAVLIPGHHRIEHWLIEKLTHAHAHDMDHVKIKKTTLKMKKPSE